MASIYLFSSSFLSGLTRSILRHFHYDVDAVEEHIIREQIPQNLNAPDDFFFETVRPLNAVLCVY